MTTDYKYNLCITIFQSKDTLSALTRYINLQPQFAIFFLVYFYGVISHWALSRVYVSIVYLFACLSVRVSVVNS